ncbi:MAG: SPFH domain-containing protein [Planctomycetota bacterium]|mgnify:CR=1 FL=1
MVFLNFLWSYFSYYLGAIGFFMLLMSFYIKGRVIVGESQAVIVERYKKFRKICHPGVNFINPIYDTLRVIYPERIGMERYFLDVRERILETPAQSVITKDNVSLMVDALLYLKIVDAQKAVYEIDNLDRAIQFLTLSSLRNILGDMALDETLISKDKVNEDLRKTLEEATDKWGIKVLRVEIKDLVARSEVQSAMQKQMEAERSKRAWILEAEGLKASEILKAEGEQQASIIRAQGDSESRLIKAKAEAEIQKIHIQIEADRIVMIHDAMLHHPPSWEVILLRYFESLEKLTQGQATKIFFPIETPSMFCSKDLLKQFFLGEMSGKTEPAKKRSENEEKKQKKEEIGSFTPKVDEP